MTRAAYRVRHHSHRHRALPALVGAATLAAALFAGASPAAADHGRERGNSRPYYGPPAVDHHRGDDDHRRHGDRRRGRDRDDRHDDKGYRHYDKDDRHYDKRSHHYDRHDYRHRGGHGQHRFVVPRVIHKHHHHSYRPYYHGQIFFPAHRHYHPVYHFPVLIDSGYYAYQPHYYCGSSLFATGGFPIGSGGFFGFQIGF